MQAAKRNDPLDVPAGTARRVRSSGAVLLNQSIGNLPFTMHAGSSSETIGERIEDLAGLHHGVHDDGKLARDGDGGALEAYFLS